MSSATVSRSSTAACGSQDRSDARSTSSPINEPGVRPTRRALLAGGLAAAVTPGLAFGQAGQRAWDLIRNGSVIGSHTLDASVSGGQVTMRIAILIEVRVLGLRAFVYDHNNTEVWEDGRLVSLDATTNNNGDQEFSRARRQGDGLFVEGNEGAGALPVDARPTTYWNIANFDHRPWFSSQSGKQLDVSITQSGLAYAVRGDFSTDLEYDAAGEWRGCSFSGRDGSVISYRETAPGQAFRPLVS